VQAKDFFAYGGPLIASHITSSFYISVVSILSIVIDQSFPFIIAFLIRLVFNDK
jgi:hypothetical protein